MRQRVTPRPSRSDRSSCRQGTSGPSARRVDHASPIHRDSVPVHSRGCKRRHPPYGAGECNRVVRGADPPEKRAPAGKKHRASARRVDHASPIHRARCRSTRVDVKGDIHPTEPVNAIGWSAELTLAKSSLLQARSTGPAAVGWITLHRSTGTRCRSTRVDVKSDIHPTEPVNAIGWSAELTLPRSALLQASNARAQRS